MANSYIKDSAFVRGDGPQAGKRPSMSGRGKAPVSDAGNSAKPPNPGGKNLLKKISSKGLFKTGITK